MTTPKLIARLLMLGCLSALSAHGTEQGGAVDFLWSFPTAGNVVAAAACDREGRVYFGTASDSAADPVSVFYALTSEGEEIWSRSFPDWLTATPVVTDSKVYVSCYDGSLYCLDKVDGGEVWHVETSGRVDSTAALDTPGTVYFGSRDRFVRAVSPMGDVVWATFLFGGVASSPLVDEKTGRLYIADLSNTVYALSLADGEILWSYKPRQGNVDGVRLRFYSSPGLDRFGYLYLGSGDGYIYAVNTNSGHLFWREETEGIVDSSPVFSLEDRAFIANRAGVLYGIDTVPNALQRVLWTTEVGQVFYSSPIVDSVGNVFICGAFPGAPNSDPLSTLSYVDGASGELLWRLDVDGYVDSSPVLDASGNLYLGTSANQFHKIRGRKTLRADANWPMAHGVPSGHGRYEVSFGQWLQDSQIPLEIADTDLDGDGLTNFDEFVFGSNPRLRDLPLVESAVRRDEGSTAFYFSAPIGIRPDFHAEYSLDMHVWETIDLTGIAALFERTVDLWNIRVALDADGIDHGAYWRVKWDQ